jgi:hypothetical protein
LGVNIFMLVKYQISLVKKIWIIVMFIYLDCVYVLYVPLVVNISRFFPHSLLITGFITMLIQWVPLMEQELLTLPEHLSSPPVFSGILVTRSLVLCVCFVDRFLSLCPFLSMGCLITPLVFSNSSYINNTNVNITSCAHDTFLE